MDAAKHALTKTWRDTRRLTRPNVLDLRTDALLSSPCASSFPATLPDMDDGTRGDSVSEQLATRHCFGRLEDPSTASHEAAAKEERAKTAVLVFMCPYVRKRCHEATRALQLCFSSGGLMTLCNGLIPKYSQAAEN
eukprot:2195452-Amphidinium_carterae.1